MKKLIFASIACLALFSCQPKKEQAPSPAEIVSASFDAAKSKDYESFVDYFFFSEEDRADLLNFLSAYATDSYEARAGIDSVEIVSENVSEDGNFAKVETTVRYCDGTSETSDSDLLLLDGNWFISI